MYFRFGKPGSFPERLGQWDQLAGRNVVSEDSLIRSDPDFGFSGLGEAVDLDIVRQRENFGRVVVRVELCQGRAVRIVFSFVRTECKGEF